MSKQQEPRNDPPYDSDCRGHHYFLTLNDTLMTSASIKSLVLPCVESRPKLSRRLWDSVAGGNLRKSCWYDRDVVPREYSLLGEKRESRITRLERIEERFYTLNGRIMTRFSIFTCACLFGFCATIGKGMAAHEVLKSSRNIAPQGWKEF